MDPSLIFLFFMPPTDTPTNPTQADKQDGAARQVQPLSDAEIQEMVQVWILWLIHFTDRFCQDPIYQRCKQLEKENSDLFTEIQKSVGFKETETGLAPPSQWDLQSDKSTLQRDQALIVGRVLKIYQSEPNPEDQLMQQGDEDVVQTAKYIVNLRFVIAFVFVSHILFLIINAN